MKSCLRFVIIPALLLTTFRTAHAWNLYLDGSTVPGAPDWQSFVDSQEDSTASVEFVDPVGGTNNLALRISTETGANEWYVGPSAASETMGGMRFRLVDFSPTGKENLLCVTTRSTPLSPAPSITLVDGRYKLWSYVIADSEIMDLGPVVNNEWHTAYLWARNDGSVKLWWDGKLVLDGNTPAVNPYDAYLEWGCGSWQYDASATAEFDWVGWGSAADLPIGVVTVPANGTSYHNAASGFDFTLTSFSGVASNAVRVAVDGVDRTGDLVLTGAETNWQGHLGGLVTNRTYQVLITVTDRQTNTSKLTVDFDTFSQSNFMVEAEDWNFESGKFLDAVALSSVPGASNYLERVGTAGIDESDLDPDPSTAKHDYRSSSPVGTEAAQDVLRQKYLDAQANDTAVADYCVNSTLTNEWLNYTRTFSAGKYYVYARLASTNQGPFEAALAKVSGAASENQIVTPLGSFKGETGRGVRDYQFIPLTDAQSNKVVVALGGVETLRATTVTETYSANSYMLVPAPALVPRLEIALINGKAVLSWPAEAAGFSLQSASSLAPANWSSVADPVVVANGRSSVTVELTGTALFFRFGGSK